MNLDYAYEKFFDAVDIMATSTGTLSERLEDAYLSSLMRLKPDDLPEEIQGMFATLQKEITRTSAQADEGTVKATVAQMSDEEIEQHAKNIMYMLATVVDAFHGVDED